MSINLLRHAKLAICVISIIIDTPAIVVSRSQTLSSQGAYRLEMIRPVPKGSGKLTVSSLFFTPTKFWWVISSHFFEVLKGVQFWLLVTKI